jgi:hypothetical protein
MQYAGRSPTATFYNISNMSQIGSPVAMTETSSMVYEVDVGSSLGAYNIVLVRIDDPVNFAYVLVGSGTVEVEESLSLLQQQGADALVLLSPVYAQNLSDSDPANVDLSAYNMETKQFIVSVNDAEGIPIDFTAFTAQLVIEDNTKTERYVYDDGDLVKTNGSFGFTVDSSVTNKNRVLRWSLRDIADLAVIVTGTLQVNYTPVEG